MPSPLPPTGNGKPRKIQRSHSGCKSCRRRGKKCDESKPRCQACTRLSLGCSYGVDFSFQIVNKQQFKSPPVAQTPSRASVMRSKPIFKSPGGVAAAPLPPALISDADLEINYLSHFHSHVRHLLPSLPPDLPIDILASPCLRFAILCISASNLSMLNAQVQFRLLTHSTRRSVFSPDVNKRHHDAAQKYHDEAIWHCRNASNEHISLEAPAYLAARVLLAYYHHASSDHLKFRLAVGESILFTVINRSSLIDSVSGADVLQMWYRLCTSHRPAKPPALWLEGEGARSSGPRMLPSATDQLYLHCIIGMNADDLIYDILIKTMEIRAKLVLFRCAARTYHVSEQSSEIGSLAHEIWNNILGRKCDPDEYTEAREGFMQRSHLLGLLDVQKDRLKVWKSRLLPNQLPSIRSAGSCSLNNEISTPPSVFSGQIRAFPMHRDSMNALYCLLCELVFEESSEIHASSQQSTKTTSMENVAHAICQIAGSLDFSTSNTSDVYTFSLTEVLLQLVFSWQSGSIFQYILDFLWPELENRGRGYEHSHYPTHLAKRIIAQLAESWSSNRAITLATPAVAEDISKLKLLDINHPVDLAVCGYNRIDGRCFIERVLLS